MINFRQQLLKAGGSSEKVDDYISFIQSHLGGSGNYFEKHHILPKKLFPAFASSKENLVTLTGREHLQVHYILCQAFPQNLSIQAAFRFMVLRSKALNLGFSLESLPEELLVQFEISRRKHADFMRHTFPVRQMGGGVIRVRKEEFDSKKHTHLLQNKVCVKHRASKKTLLISKDSYDPTLHEFPSAGKVTVRVRISGEHIQIPQDQFDSELHANLTENRVTVLTPDGAFSSISTEDPRYLSGELSHVNAGMASVRNIETGQVERVRSDQFNPATHEGLLKGRVTWKPNEGRTAIIDQKGQFRWVSKDTPNLQFNLDAGIWHYPFVGKRTVKDAAGNCFDVDVDDPRIQTGELTSPSKGMATVRDAAGQMFQVPKDDPRIQSGELVSILTGRIRCVDTTGKQVRVYPDDPRLISGDLKRMTLLNDDPDHRNKIRRDNRKKKTKSKQSYPLQSSCLSV